MNTRCLVFRAGSLRCALRLQDIVETMRPLPVHPLAGTPDYLHGVCVLRGAPTPVVDLALLLGDEPTPAIRFITVRTPERPIALATGPILRIMPLPSGHSADDPAEGPVASVSVLDSQPLLHLHPTGLLPDRAWAAALAGLVTS